MKLGDAGGSFTDTNITLLIDVMLVLLSGMDCPVYQMSMSSLVASDGLLVVPAGTRVTAYTLSIHP
jgi:hypothetical protein